MNEDGVCYCTALRRATRRVTELYDAALAPYGVGVAQFALLRAVERAGRPTLTELGRSAGLDRSTVGRNVRVLVRMGLLKLDQDDGDLRASAVALTTDGRDLIQRADPVWAGVQREVEDRLGAGGADRLLVTLQGISTGA